MAARWERRRKKACFGDAPLTPERKPNGQFTGVARLSGLEIALIAVVGSVLGILAVFALLWAMN